MHDTTSDEREGEVVRCKTDVDNVIEATGYPREEILKVPSSVDEHIAHTRKYSTAHARTHARSHKHMHTRTHMHTHTHTHTHKHTHAHARLLIKTGREIQIAKSRDTYDVCVRVCVRVCECVRMRACRVCWYGSLDAGVGC